MVERAQQFGNFQWPGGLHRIGQRQQLLGIELGFREHARGRSACQDWLCRIEAGAQEIILGRAQRDATGQNRQRLEAEIRRKPGLSGQREQSALNRGVAIETACGANSGLQQRSDF